MDTAKQPTHVGANPPADRPALCLLAGQDSGQLDSLMSGGVYALTPQSPPARYPLWAGLLRDATRDGRICHVLIRVPAPDFLARLVSDGWPDATDAWRAERLRIYPMVAEFSTHVFRLDIEGLTAEFGYWGFRADELLLIDAADELLSLHDVTLATSQLTKLRHWARNHNVPMLLNFSMGATSEAAAALTRLMDNLSGLARLHNDHTGPVLTLEYWQGALGTAAERMVLLEQGVRGYALRPVKPAAEAVAGGALALQVVESGAERLVAPPPPPALSIAQDKVWARELQMLTGLDWQSRSEIAGMLALCKGHDAPLLVLRFGPDSALSELASDIHRLRTQIGLHARIVVAEHRVSLRYTNEMMLLRLGASAIIRQDIPLVRWPAALDALKGQSARAMPDVDVGTALANAASPQSRGYLEVPDFLSQLYEAQERSRVLDVPFALAAITPKPYSIGTAIAAAHFRRNGDFITTDGRLVVVFFNACSVTRGMQVLDSTFEGVSDQFVVKVDWMSSDRDVDGLISRLADGHASDPFDLAAYEEAAQAARALFEAPARIPVDQPAEPTVGEPDGALVGGQAPTVPRPRSRLAENVSVANLQDAVVTSTQEAATSSEPVHGELHESAGSSANGAAARQAAASEPLVYEVPEHGTQPPNRAVGGVRDSTAVLRRLVRSPAPSASRPSSAG